MTLHTAFMTAHPPAAAPLRRGVPRLALHTALAAAAWCCSTAAVRAAPANAPHAPPMAAEAHTLGTLFYTPAQRQRINQARRGGNAGDITNATAQATATAALRLDGLVRTGRGTTTAFINGQEAGHHLAGTGATVNIEAQGVRLDTRTRLVVGQSVVPGTGHAPQDLVPTGSVVSGSAARSATPAANAGNTAGTLHLQRSRPAPLTP
jgi:hypothetical protein